MRHDISAGRAGQVLAMPFAYLLFAISHLFVRRKDRWVFGSWSGKRFTDNTAALFRYIGSLDDRPHITWITTTRAVRDEVAALGLPVAYRWSPNGIWACARAGGWIYDGMTKDINFWLSGGATKVLLRHGVGIKRIERAIQSPDHRLFRLFHGRPLDQLAATLATPWHRVRPDATIATSDEHARQAVDFYGVTRETVHVTGFPRHDALFQPRENWRISALEDAEVTRIEDDERAAFLFLPTFRDGGGSTWKWADLAAAADAAGVRLYAKPHLVDALRGSADGEDIHGPGLRFVDPTVDPIYLYPASSGVITDYSSVAFDAILLGKPVAYFVPDLDDYSQIRGLYYDFETVAPGPRCRTPEELGQALKSLASDGLGEYRDQYDAVRRRFHKYTEGGSCERVFQLVTDVTGWNQGR